MDWEKELFNENEKPLDRLVTGYSHTSVFRTIGFVGDSLSSGEFETVDADGTHHYHDFYEYSWGQYIARKNGLLAYNFSKGGMSTLGFVNYFGDECGAWSEEKACQAYVIALGVNDIYGKRLNMEIGSMDDIDREDYKKNKETFLGCYAHIVSRLKEVSPDAKFFFVTVPNTDTPERDEKTFGIINTLYQLADYFDNAYVIDLYKYGPVHDAKFKEKFYLHYHLNPSGYILTAQIIDSYIDYIVRHNPEDFKHAGFIGTDIQYK